MSTVSCMVMFDERTWTSSADEVDRIRAVFAISEESPVPRVSIGSLLIYHRYLSTQLSFPFRALYAETKAPVRQLVRYIKVVGLVDEIRNLSEGIVCRVEGLRGIRELPLAEIAVREDDPEYRLIDDYASWLLDQR